MGSEQEDFLRLQELFFAAQELPAAEREGFVQEYCPPELRGKLRQLLANDISEFPERPGVPELLPDLTPGQVIDVYRIVRLLGEGGMGTVYEAQRVDVPRRCCIKVIRAGASQEFLEQRFRQEINILAQLEHNHIARWTDSRQTTDGRTYLVMDYVDGQPIDRYCEERRFSIRERLQLFRQICLAIRYAHSKGVVHRDLKPSNILVEPVERGEAEPGKVKLLDFGIAKLLDRSAAVDTESSSTLVFTPNYASPEQLTGGAVGRASDLYALGIVLYLLLTGRLPFERSALPVEALRQQLERETVIPPSRAVEIELGVHLNF
jgi:serine/threonine protein kinase